jgi:hypothetical protein
MGVERRSSRWAPSKMASAGVLVATGEGYAVVETAAGTGNRLLLFLSKSRALARSLFETELRPPQDQPPFG